MGDVSYDDDADRSGQQPGPDAASGGPSEHQSDTSSAQPYSRPEGADDRDFSDTQPLGTGGTSYPPPLPGHPEPQRQPGQPGPYAQPYGQQPSSYPTQPQPG